MVKAGTLAHHRLPNGMLADPAVTRSVVEHKDLTSRFGVASIQTLLKTQGRELVIANEAENCEEDLMADFVAIITSFTARLYGRHRAQRKTQAVLACLQARTEESA